MENELKSSGAGSWKAADRQDNKIWRLRNTQVKIATGAQLIQKRGSSNENQTSQLNKQLKPTLNYFSDLL